MLTFRRAFPADLPLLVAMNQRLIRDEGHRNAMNYDELFERMRRWLEGDCIGAIFFDDEAVVGYAVYRETASDVRLRHFFIEPRFRRRKIGTAAWHALAAAWPPEKRFAVEALAKNEIALAFWRSLGYRDYAITLERDPQVQ